SGRPRRGRQNGSSSAGCRSEPLVRCAVGGSGSCSMLANRNASGQEVKASTRDGDRFVGTGNGMTRWYARGARQLRDCPFSRVSTTVAVVHARESRGGGQRAAAKNGAMA